MASCDAVHRPFTCCWNHAALAARAHFVVVCERTRHCRARARTYVAGVVPQKCSTSQGHWRIGNEFVRYGFARRHLECPADGRPTLVAAVNSDRHLGNVAPALDSANMGGSHISLTCDPSTGRPDGNRESALGPLTRQRRPRPLRSARAAFVVRVWNLKVSRGQRIPSVTAGAIKQLPPTSP
jgi:hypothetical protein